MRGKGNSYSKLWVVDQKPGFNENVMDGFQRDTYDEGRMESLWTSGICFGIQSTKFLIHHEMVLSWISTKKSKGCIPHKEQSSKALYPINLMKRKAASY